MLYSRSVVTKKLCNNLAVQQEFSSKFEESTMPTKDSSSGVKEPHTYTLIDIAVS